MKSFNLLKGIWLMFFIFSLSLISNAQTTYDFSAGATITTPAGSPWATEAVITIGGVNYKLTSGGNGGWSLSSNNGSANSASIRKSGAGGDSFLLQRVDGQPFNFYSIYVRHEGYNSYNGLFGIVIPPWYEVTYNKVSGAPESDFDNSPIVGASNAITTTTNTFTRTLTVNSVSIFFKANNSYWIDDIRVGTATGTEVAPTVTTASAASIQTNSAVLGGNVTADGGATVTDRGIVWSTSGTPTTSNNKVQMTNGTGTFSSTVTGLPAGTLINYRAYAVNTKGTSYGANIPFTTLSSPSISSATYNVQTGVLNVTGSNFQAKAGAANDVDVSTLVLGGEGGITYTLTSGDVEISSATAFTVTLNPADRTALSPIINKNGTSSTGGANYILTAGNGWMANLALGADASNTVTVSGVAIPTITSATYNGSTGIMTVSGTGFLSRSGAANDIDVSRMAISGQGGAIYNLTSVDVDVNSGQSFVVALNAADRAALVTILNKNGLSAQDANIYNLAASEDWNIGADAALNIADLTGNGVQATLPVLPLPLTLPNPVYGSAYSQNISASGGNGTYTFAISAGALPAGISLSTAGILSGTPSAAGAFNFTIRATDGTSATGTRAYSFTISAPTIIVSPATLPGTAAGTAYSQTLSSTGGVAPYTYVISAGALPAGISLSSAGLLSGIPSATGTFNFTVRSSDASAFNGNRSYSLAVSPAAITISPAILVNPVAGSAYSQTLASNGGVSPYAYAITAGALPAGISLSVSGVLSGTATVSGNFTFTVTSTDASLSTKSQIFNISVLPPTIVLSPATTPSAVLGTAYNQAISASGGTAPYTYAVTAGALPAGLNLSSTGTISGTPLAFGNFLFTITATDALSFSGSRAYAMNISQAAITISPASLPKPVYGAAYNQSLVSTGGIAPYTYSITSGVLPAGMSFSSAGVLSGTPKATGPFSITVKSTDASLSAVTQVYSFLIDAPLLVISPASLPAPVLGNAYSQALSTLGGVAPYTYSLTSGSLPSGLSFNSAGVLSGAATVFGSFNFTITSTDAAGASKLQAYNLNIAQSVITISPANLPDPVLGTAYSQALSSSGGTAPYTYSITAGALPAGLSFTSTGILSGTPSAAGSFTLSIKSTDAYSSTITQSYTLAIGIPTLTITPASLPDPVLGAAYSQTLATSGGTAPYSYSITSGALPAGIFFTSAGLLSGTANAFGTFNFTVRSTDAFSVAKSQAYTLNIAQAVIAITPAVLVDPVLAVAYNQSLSSTGGTAPYSYSLTGGALPPGILLSNSGSLSGAATATGSYTFTIKSTDAGLSSKSVAYTIVIAAPSIAIVPATLPDALVGTVYSQSLSATGGTAPYIYTITTGILPAGISLSSSGVLSGSPLAGGTSNFTVRATDATAGQGPYFTDKNYAINIARKTQNIVFSTAATVNYGDADFDPGAVSDSGLPISYSTSDPAVAVILAGKVQIKGAGVVTIFADQPGNSAFNAATQRAQTLTVNKATLVYTSAAVSKTYGDAIPALTGSVSGFKYADNLTSSTTGTALYSTTANASSQAGTYAVNGSGLSAANYLFTQATANATALNIGAKVINVAAVAKSKIYGDADPLIGYTFSPALLSGDAFTGSLDRAAGEGVGTYAIAQGSLALNANYSINYTPADLTINKKTIAVTAAAKSKGYGDADPALSYTFAPALVTGDVFAGSLSRVAGESSGTYAITQGTLALNANYTLSYTGANLTIAGKTITVTATAKTKFYGEADPGLDYTFTPALAAGDTFSGSLGRLPGEDAGTYPISQGSLSLGANYAIAFVSADLTINKKVITVNAVAKSKNYGSADPALTYTFAPALVTGDAFSGSLGRSVGENVGSYAITQGSLSLGTNYTIRFIGADLSIAKKAITVTALAKNKSYGDTDPALTYAFNPALITGDNFTGSLSRSVGETVGSYAIIQGSLALNANYILNYVGADLSIVKKAITVTALAKNKSYGDADPALTYAFTPALITGDNFTGTLNRSAGENAGTYPINQGSLALNANYTLNYNGAALSIGKKAIAVTATAKNKSYGEVDPTLAYTFTPALITGDTFTGSLSRVAGEGVGTYPINQGSLALNANYTLSYTGADFSITKKIITVVAAAKSKTYGDADPVLTYTFSPALGTGESLSGSLSRNAGENAGLYTITSTLSAGVNYSIDFKSANLTINKAVLNVSADAKQMCQGGDLPVLTLSYSGFKFSDNENSLTVRPTVSSSGSRSSAAGDYVLSPLGGGSLNYSFNYVNAILKINPLPVISILSDKGPGISRGETVRLTAMGASSYVWSDASGVISGQNLPVLTVRPRETTTYTVTATNGSGCSQTQSITLTVADDLSKIKANNILSPNNDGFNDKWVVENIDYYPNNEVKIFDRAGRIVYSKKGYDNSWDGTVNGTALSEGTYYYIIDFGTDRTRFKGYITLVREN